MSKKINIFIGLSVVLICILILPKILFQPFVNTDTLINKVGCRIFEFNSITVRIKADLDLKKVIIKINDNVVYTKGKQVNKVGQYYGDFLFDLYYVNQLIYTVGHWKTNNWYTNTYEFEILNDNENLVVNETILGPDSENDRFKKRYYYNDWNKLIQIDYINPKGEVYRTEEKTVNK